MERVLGALRDSWNRMVAVLFQPFDAGRYLLLTLFFLFADCGSTHSFNSNLNLDTSSMPSFGDLEPLAAGIGATVFVVGAVVILGLMLLFWGFFLYLSSQATTLSIAALRDGEPRLESMGEYSGATLALWKFRVMLMLISTAWVVVTVGVALSVLLGVGLSGPTQDVRMLSELAVGLTIVLALLVPAVLVGFADWLAIDLAAPVMMQMGGSTMQAFQTIRSSERFELGELLLYLVARILIAVVVGAVRLPITLLCCCLFMIPGVYHAVFLPILAFQRATSMHWLSGIDDRLEGLRGPTP